MNKNDIFTDEVTKESHTVIEWCNITGIKYDTMMYRLENHSVHDSVTKSTKELRKMRDKPKHTKYYTSKNGETHTISEWSEITGINKSTILYRLKRTNYDIDKALYDYDNNISKITSSNGETHTIPEWASISGVNIYTLYDRINNGMSIDEAIKKPSYKLLSSSNGETHSIQEWASISGVNIHTLYRRINNGMSIDEAIKKPSYKLLSSSNGETHTIPEWATISGVNIHTLYGRIRSGMSIDEAIKKPCHDYMTLTSSNGETHTISEWASIAGINANRLHARVRRGMSIDEAIKYTYIDRHSLLASSKGDAHSIQEWASISGININTLSTRVKRIGMSIDEAINQKVLTKDGRSKTRIYRIYRGMIQRCYNEKTSSFKYYGGRGIYICDEWRGDDGFINFRNWAMANGYDDTLSIDRIDNNGPYAPSNCRWATNKQQTCNRRNTVHITYNGETHTMSEWAEITGLSKTTIESRYSRKLPVKEILYNPNK